MGRGLPLLGLSLCERVEFGEVAGGDVGRLVAGVGIWVARLDGVLLLLLLLWETSGRLESADAGGLGYLSVGEMRQSNRGKCKDYPWNWGT